MAHMGFRMNININNNSDEKICMLGISLGGALSIDNLIEKWAPLVFKKSQNFIKY